MLHDYENIILASQSPRRLDILRAHGIEPLVMPTDTDESLPEDITMEEAVMQLSALKAEASWKSEGVKPYIGTNSVIIAADTIVYKDELMGKPADREEAYAMLASIRNTVHYVATGVTLIYLEDGRKKSFCEVTKVFCKDYSDEDIYEYIDTDKPYDKAGSYAIQSSWGKHIDRIEGDYENVVGLPYNRICEEI